MTYADADGKRLGVIRSFTLDLAYGDDENDFSIKTPASTHLPLHGLAYIDGTGWGGVIDGEGIDADGGEGATRSFTGRTWHGIIAGRVVVPDGDYYEMTGEAHAAMRSLLSHVGLSAPFAVPDEDSGFELSFRVARFDDAYSAVRKALKSAGARLDLERRGGRTWLRAVPVKTVARTGMGSFKYKASSNTRPVNHLVCAGSGELSERVVVHLYADESGSVSRSQTLFGVDEVAALYDSNNSDEEGLIEDGTKKLMELNDRTADVSVTIPWLDGLDVGDSVDFRDPDTGFSAVSGITKVIVSVPASGNASISYETGGTTRPVSLKG